MNRETIRDKKNKIKLYKRMLNKSVRLYKKAKENSDGNACLAHSMMAKMLQNGIEQAEKNLVSCQITVLYESFKPLPQIVLSKDSELNQLQFKGIQKICFLTDHKIPYYMHRDKAYDASLNLCRKVRGRLDRLGARHTELVLGNFKGGRLCNWRRHNR